MPIYRTTIITPWVEAAQDTSPEPRNHGKLADDYPHQMTVTARVFRELPATRTLWQQAIEDAQRCGDLFRAAFNRLEDERKERVGFGVRLPRVMYEALRDKLNAEQKPMDPWIMGPHEDNQDMLQVLEVRQTVVQEGIRYQEDVTGHPTHLIAPAPNQFTVYAVAEESVVLAIEADAQYWLLASGTLPETPEGTPPPANAAIDFPWDQPMDPARVTAYEQWQANYPNGPAARYLRDINRRLSDGVGDATYGEVTVGTVAWQRGLTGQDPTSWRVPLREVVQEIAARMPGLTRGGRDPGAGFPAAGGSVMVGV